ncbi:M23 family metallopeptidase [Paludicola sp. MB14-C6]|uniref:M23 family metallopeptidase n=1 Tax=Paludihabitans sp. MB14-C6 TaxID=3070656 RepID=UPI0027DAE95E|nr:M23 family metallopeptidase [Paludicola sp. MB14-C6]WMJ23750.1 M23 family metallopeptidase [Paludicola sp. MB14-C6]
MDDIQDIQSQIEELRAKRRQRSENVDYFEDFNENEQKEKKERKDDGILGVLTFQGIVAVILAIIYVLSLTFFKPQTTQFTDDLKNILHHDFSFQEKVYDAVGSLFTYLNSVSPVQAKLDGQGGESIEIIDNVMPSNVTFAPVIFTGRITYPIAKGRVTSKFEVRTNPLTKKQDFHNALDIAALEGSPIYAATDGVVIKAEEDKSLGNYIIIDHGNDFTTTYGHCSRLIAKVGMKIREGEVIAKVGSTGASTGPHVHFAVKKDGLYFNPEYLYNTKLFKGK